MRIGILTFHRALNCGAMLQAWALKTVLERAGYEVGFISNHVGEVSRWYPLPKTGSFLGRGKGALLSLARNMGSFGCLDVARERFGAFRKRWLPEIAAENCDAIVVGSDQVWRPELTGAEKSLFQGKSFPVGIPMLSYAASVGDRKLGEGDLQELACGLNRFQNISVRETLIKNQVSKVYSGDVEVVADPTLLLGAEDYSAISTVPKNSKPYLFAYAVHATPFFVKTARTLAHRMGLDLVMTSTSQYTRWGAPPGLTYAVSPDRMVGYIQNAECVVASSFHGTAISAIYGKPFVSLRESENNARSRPGEFLARIDDLGRLATPSTTLETIEHFLSVPMGMSSQLKLTEFSKWSSAWLESNLQKCGTSARQ